MVSNINSGGSLSVFKHFKWMMILNVFSNLFYEPMNLWLYETELWKPNFTGKPWATQNLAHFLSEGQNSLTL